VRIVLLGPPGAGKGTQAVRLAQHLGVPHIATGDMFRQAVESGSPLGHEVKGYMEGGELVPNALTDRVMRERLGQHDALQGFVLDGYPRNTDQAGVLDEALAAQGVTIDHVVKFMVTGDEIVDRLSGRWVCPVCKSAYHLVSAPPQKPGVCDNEGAVLVQRHDDKKETVLHRLDVYGAQTKPLFDLYGGRGLLRDVDAIGTPDDVFDRLLKAIQP
jgi:adenylate kinase